MIKKWNQFIKESIDHWIEKEGIEDLFIDLKDEGYNIRLLKGVVYEEKSEFYFLDPKNNPILLEKEYYLGYEIVITRSRNEGESKDRFDDVTESFRSTISYLKGEGYKVCDIEHYQDKLSTDDISFKDGDIFFTDWAGPVGMYDFRIIIYQPELIRFTPLELAKLYEWQDYTVKSNNIYCEVSIEDIYGMFFYGYSYRDELINGIDVERYYENNYCPDIKYLFKHYLSNENEILAIKSLIKESKGLDNFIKRYDELSDYTTEYDIINFLLRSENHSILKNICLDSEIIDEVKQLINDWQASAHCEKDQEILDRYFDGILEKEGLDFTKEMKPGKKYYKKKTDSGRRNVYYDDIIWYYIVKFEGKWLSERANLDSCSFYNESLTEILRCWSNFTDLKIYPRFSDSGDINIKEMNKEIQSLLKNYINN